MTHRRGGLEEIVHPVGAPGSSAQFCDHMQRRERLLAPMWLRRVRRGRASACDRPRFKPPLANWLIA